MRSENIKVLVNVTGLLFIFRYPTQFVSGVFRASWLNPANQEGNTLHSSEGSIISVTCQVFSEL